MVRDLLTTLRSLGEWQALKGLKTARPGSPRYWLYLLQQSEKSRRYAHRPNHRVEDLMGRALSYPTVAALAERGDASVLCVGCRNADELDAWEEAGFATVRGVDLFSVDDRIQTMDMHDLGFDDASFDLVYSCHSLEHSFDPDRAAGEFLRVARPGAAVVIEVPVQFPTSLTDRQDYGSAEGLRALFGAPTDAVLLAENEPSPDGSTVARLIFHTHGAPA